MKKLLFSLSFIIFHFSFSVAQKGYPITPVPFTQVKVAPGTFWGQRLQASRDVTVPLAFSKCESEGRYKNFDNAALLLSFEVVGFLPCKRPSVERRGELVGVRGCGWNQT